MGTPAAGRKPCPSCPEQVLLRQIRPLRSPVKRSSEMVGRVGLEPTTSPLSGVRSNHLSYQPKPDDPKPGDPQPDVGQPGSLRSRAAHPSRGCRRQAGWPLMRKGYAGGGASSLLAPDRPEPVQLSPNRPEPVQLGVGDRRGRPDRDPGPCQQSALRKEVIQPQVPLRLPCYDFTPVADLTVVGCLQS